MQYFKIYFGAGALLILSNIEASLLPILIGLAQKAILAVSLWTEGFLVCHCLTVYAIQNEPHFVFVLFHFISLY